MRRAFLRPVAKRVASKEATAPEAKRPVNRAVSSTVTAPRPAVPPEDARPADTCGREGPFAYEGLHQRGDADHRLAYHVLREVDDVGAEVAERSG